MFTVNVKFAYLTIPFDRLLSPALTETTKTAKREARQAFYSFAATHGKNPILTGRTMRETNAYVTRNRYFLTFGLSTWNAKYRFITQNTQNYAQFPFFGLGTSRKYGPRKWLGVAAKRTTESFINSLQKIFS